MKKRQLQIANMESKAFQIWKEKPPGPEQKELEKMFNSNSIDATTTADSVRKSNAIFQKFSGTVFASHFRKTKAKFGLCGKLS